MRYLIARAAEPSTWATLTAVLAAVGFAMPPSIAQNVALIGMGLAGLAGVLLREKPPG